MKWYEYTPSDTLFLRGSEPMVSGTSFETTQIFPPPVSVIKGAVRTAVLAQHRVSIRQYKKGNSISDKIGRFGEKAPFKVLGPMIRYQSRFFVPAPGTWFTENRFTDNDITIRKAGPIDNDVKNRLGLKSSARLMGWVKHKKEIKSLAGHWVSLEGLAAGETVFKNGETIFLSNEQKNRLFSLEERTGIALDSRRSVEESRIYTARHIRLKPGVSLVWGIDRPCGLEPEGMLALGGEQRFGMYQEIEKDFQFPKTGDMFLSLSPVPVNPGTSKELVASGKIVYRGGWDLARQFHKDMIGYYPAGAVFKKNVNDLCIFCK